MTAATTTLTPSKLHNLTPATTVTTSQRKKPTTILSTVSAAAAAAATTALNQQNLAIVSSVEDRIIETDSISSIPIKFSSYPSSKNALVISNSKRLKNSALFSRDVIDNKIPHICNIKRMTEIYCNENERLKTFQLWPLDFIDKNVLAKTGFFYTGDDDKVKCYFCEVEIGRWESSDNPISEHTKWSPNCPLMRRRTTNNVPIDEAALNSILPPVSYDVCGANEIEIRPNAYAEGSITSFVSPINSSLPNSPNSLNGSSTPQQETNFLYPDHPEYAIESARLRSFADWPRTMKQKPIQLSEAGFFYTGTGDRVKCFSCGGGLKDWDENDDPWEQHALWLSNCHYLKLMKGTTYIQEVVEKFKAAEEESKETSSPTDDNEEGSATNDESLVNNINVEIQHNIPSTSATTNVPTAEKSANGQTIKNNIKINITNKIKHCCKNCTANSASGASSSSSSASSCSDEDNCSSSSVNSNRSKEAETVCKQPKLNCNHHHISRNLQEAKQESQSISEEKLCKICYGAEYNTAFLPCGHVVACAKCASSVTKCPLCRKPFTDVMRVYFS